MKTKHPPTTEGRSKAAEELRAVPREKLEAKARDSLRQVAFFAGIDPARLRRVSIDLDSPDPELEGRAGMAMEWEPELAPEERARFESTLDSFNRVLGGRAIIRRDPS